MKDLFDLSGKTAVITGGAGYLGTLFAEALASYGANIVLVDIDREDCVAKAKEIAHQHNVKALGVPTDISQHQEVENMANHTMEAFGQIDVLVNNAAIRPPGFFSPLEEYSLDVWEQVIATNLTGAFLCSRTIGPIMVSQRNGSIISISSIYGIVGPDQRVYKDSPFNTPAVYSVTKAGLLGLTYYLSTYWAKYGIRVNAITPGGVFPGTPRPLSQQLLCTGTIG